MKTSRLEAFSDCVISIIITIMVLELKAPHGADFATLRPLLPKFISYILSFIYLGIYWSNHHHLFVAMAKINGKVLWANLFLLFSLSLIPLTTAWMGENSFTKYPVILYGTNLLMCALGFLLVEKAAVLEKENKTLAAAIADRRKEYISAVAYSAGIVLAFFWPWTGIALFALVAVLWALPDTRIERKLEEEGIPDEEAQK